MKLKLIPKSWYFLIGLILVYLILFLVNYAIFLDVINFFLDILLKILPLFLLVFILMTLTNYFITPKFVTKHLQDNRFKKWFFIVIGGVLSTGPIYMWYPFLADLKTKGLSNGLVACFLYNRAIKITLIPLILIYFNWKYVLTLFLVMILVSIIQGILIDKLMKVKNENSSSI